MSSSIKKLFHHRKNITILSFLIVLWSNFRLTLNTHTNYKKVIYIN